ncbi:MAG TPA: GAF and ANTAR domain-containing protein [Jatrophihabitans sp.]|nr:GAF and ANTAR domain-containing protein [Jatrophihabitans sp.]
MTTAPTHAPATPSALSLAQRFAELARDLATQPTAEHTWRAIVQTALSTVEGAEAAGITILRGREFHSVAPSCELVKKVDIAQYKLRSGPCVDAVLEDKVFRTGDLEHDPRWPQFGEIAARELGVHSMLAFRLYLEEDDVIGGLNLYSTKRDAFSSLSEIMGEVVATHAAIVLSGAERRDEAAHLRQALESNREIGVALGILMSRHRVTQEQAFNLLRMASQHSHRKVHDLAIEVGEIGMLDYPPATDR